MHAIIETGGKQYKVAEGDTLFIEKLNQEISEAERDAQIAAATEKYRRTNEPA